MDKFLSQGALVNDMLLGGSAHQSSSRVEFWDEDPPPFPPASAQMPRCANSGDRRSDMKGFIVNIEELTKDNDDFRLVL